MKISQAIKDLQEIYAKDGDLELEAVGLYGAYTREITLSEQKTWEYNKDEQVCQINTNLMTG